MRFSRMALRAKAAVSNSRGFAEWRVLVRVLRIWLSSDLGATRARWPRAGMASAWTSCDTSVTSLSVAVVIAPILLCTSTGVGLVRNNVVRSTAAMIRKSLSIFPICGGG